MSRHEGVSCDSCIKGNFRGLRFKCLICYDYDLCATCYEAGATNTRHTADHPMQCILTRSDYDTFYGGESISSDSPQSFCCPYCGRLGFTETALYDHVTSDHTETPYEVVCPICASLPGGEPNQVTEDFAAHLTMEHRGGIIGHNGVLRDEESNGIGRGVRRIPVTSRGSSGPRTRRPNMHFTTTGSGLTPSSNAPGSSSGSLRDRDREREREAMDPIAELLSQLSGVRRGLGGVSGPSGLGSVLGLGALGSLGGALGSIGANLSGPSPSSASNMPAPAGRGAFNDLVNNGMGNQAQPQLERQQALRLPRRQTQVISTPSTFASNTVPGSGSLSSNTGLTAPAAPPTSTAESATSSQLLLSRLGNVLKERRESNTQNSQDRSLFIQDLILSTLASGFDFDADRDLTSALANLNLSRNTSPSDLPPKKNSSNDCSQNASSGNGNDSAQTAAGENNEPSETSESRKYTVAVPQASSVSLDSSLEASSAKPIASALANCSPVSARPKQPLHHNEPKGKGPSISAVTSRRSSQHQTPSSGMRVPSASSATSSVPSSRPPSHGGSGSSQSVAPASQMVRSRSHGSNGASGASGSTGPSGGLLRKPARPQTSHPPPPPSSH